ncbi:MAG: P-loop NTPase, partial [bacterium]
KSAVVANLAVAFAITDYRVGVLDADLSGASIAHMLGVQGSTLQLHGDLVQPVTNALGIKVISIDSLVADNSTPVCWRGPEGSEFVWRGAAERSALRELLSDVQWGQLDILFFDLPAGTFQLPNLAQLVPDLDGVILVTIPSQISNIVVRRTAAFVKKHQVPLIGLVQNMGTCLCQKCGHEMNLFESHEPLKLAEDLDIPLLGKIPFDPKISQYLDQGYPFMLQNITTPTARAFLKIAEKIEKYFFHSHEISL